VNPDADDPTDGPDREPDLCFSAERAVLIATHPKTGRLQWYVDDPSALPDRAFHRVEVGREYSISSADSLLYIGGTTQGFTPDGLLLAAKCGWFGFRLVDAPPSLAPSKKAKVKPS
jgi:hypothetical protein